jgi:hypothetical protein
MRALVLATVLLTSFGLHSLRAQDQAKPPVSAQPLQSQDHPNAAKQAPQSSTDDQTRRTMNRMGSGIDWDHRKPGRHWRISPHHPGT